MKDFFFYFFGTPSLTLDWFFRAIGGAFGLFFIGLMLFGLTGFVFNIFKSIRNKTFLNDIKVGLTAIWKISFALAKIAFVLFVATIVLKECGKGGGDEQSYINY